MATIDYAAFPHIIDLIWSHLDVDGLLVLRNLCSAWRARANKILQRHMLAEVLLGMNEFRLKLSLKLSENAAPRAEATAHTQLPQYFVDYGTAVTDDDDLGSMPRGIAGNVLAGVFGNLDVVDIIYREKEVEKWLPEMLRLFRPDTVVRSVIPRSGQRRLEIWCGGSTQVYFLNIGNMLQFEFPEAPDTLILNLDCVGPKASPLEIQFQRLLDPPDVAGTDITFVLDHGDLQGNRPRAEWVENLEMTLAPLWSTTTVTLVGLERFFTQGWVYDIFKHDFYVTAMRWFKYIGHDAAYPNAEADMLSRFAVAVKHKQLRMQGAVRLLTHEEYEAELGHDKYMLYTCYEQQNQIPLVHVSESPEK